MKLDYQCVGTHSNRGFMTSRRADTCPPNPTCAAMPVSLLRQSGTHPAASRQCN
jgi:hypothetical protein